MPNVAPIIESPICIKQNVGMLMTILFSVDDNNSSKSVQEKSTGV